MEIAKDPSDWAQEEYGHAKLGDVRRVARLMKMAEQFARTPGGTVTAVFTDGADQQGAFDWLENPKVSAAAVLRARDVATARRARGMPFVFVPTDGSSVSVTDRGKAKETGPLGDHVAKGRGDKVHNALVISPDGTPLGICAQQWWVRNERPARKDCAKRETGEKETQHWLDVRAQTLSLFLEVAPLVDIWFQHDREADAWPIVLDAVSAGPGEYTTIRAAWDRRLIAASDEPAEEATRKLRGKLNAVGACGRYSLRVPAGKHRTARTAVMEVRFAEVTLDLRNQITSKHYSAPVHVVLAREVSPVPKGEHAIEWLLLTTYPVRTFEDARQVLFGYAQRWRIEEFHKAMKSGCCNAQETQLAGRSRRLKWYAIASSVAVRVMRLTYLARERPATLANKELTTDEMVAMQELRPRRVLPPSDRLTLAEAVQWIATIGGYTGKSSGGPPGMLTLARGLGRVGIAAIALRNHRLRTGANRLKTVDS